MIDHKSLIRKISKILPELASAKDLVKIGMYRTEQAAYAARTRGECPPFMRIPARGIVYPKIGVIEFLQNAFNRENGTEPKIANALISNSKVSRLR